MNFGCSHAAIASSPGHSSPGASSPGHSSPGEEWPGDEARLRGAHKLMRKNVTSWTCMIDRCAHVRACGSMYVTSYIGSINAMAWQLAATCSGVYTAVLTQIVPQLGFCRYDLGIRPYTSLSDRDGRVDSLDDWRRGTRFHLVSMKPAYASLELHFQTSLEN